MIKLRNAELSFYCKWVGRNLNNKDGQKSNKESKTRRQNGWSSKLKGCVSTEQCEPNDALIFVGSCVSLLQGTSRNSKEKKMVRTRVSITHDHWIKMKRVNLRKGRHPSVYKGAFCGRTLSTMWANYGWRKAMRRTPTNFLGLWNQQQTQEVLGEASALLTLMMETQRSMTLIRFGLLKCFKDTWDIKMGWM
jgi:hypothetical protein